MNFKELVDAVIINTNRPELLEETKLAVKRATRKMHNLDFFSYDLTEGNIRCEPTMSLKFNLSQLGQNFRKIHSIGIITNSGVVHIPKYDSAEFTPRKGVTTWTIYGTALNLTANQAFSSLLVRYYTFPLTTEDNYDSWIAHQFPFAIIDEASKDVLASVGNNERAALFASLVGGKLPRPNGHIGEILSSVELGETDGY
jgi:hypothetical protein